MNTFMYNSIVDYSYVTKEIRFEVLCKKLFWGKMNIFFTLQLVLC
jgi:hypothetical protein